MALCVYQGGHGPTCGDLPQPTPEAQSLDFGGLQAALQASPFACMLSTISYLRWQACASRQFDKFVT